MSDTNVGRGQRRIRALLTLDDLQMLAVQHVADQANVDLTCPDVMPVAATITASPLPGSHAAEIIIEVRL